MSDVREILERGVAGVGPPEDPLDRMLRRRARRRRNGRIGVAVLALLITSVATWSLVEAFQAEPGEVPADRPPASPAYDKIAFMSAGDIWLVDPDGTGGTRLTEGMSAPGGAWWNQGYMWSRALSWSPDATRIAFTSGPGIYTVNADGTGLTQLTGGGGGSPPGDGCPTWSPDGTRIAFYRATDDPNRGEIHAMNADGTDVKRLADTVGEVCPAWSPDGTRIALATWVTEDGVEVREVSVMNADGTELRAINSEFLFWGEEVHWSPDGTEVIFTSSSGGEDGLYAIDVDSGETRLLVEHDLLEEGFSSHLPLVFSPDGTRIAFVRAYEPDDAECIELHGKPDCDRFVFVVADIFVVNTDGSGLTQLTRHPDGYDGRPRWSPDGTRIAFVSDRHGDVPGRRDTEPGPLGLEASDEQVFVMNADGSGVTQLTFPSPEGPFPAAHRFGLAWSPLTRP